jgi:CheY-like chemotaxis protein
MPAPRRILVADDETHITQVVSLKLRNAGFEVIVANDGEEALELASAEIPCLLITDLQMPFLSGLELARKLHERPATRSIPIVVLTARGLGLSDEDLSGTSIRRVMSKPFSPKQVLECTLEILEQTREDAEAA